MLKIVLVLERSSIAENSALKPDTHYLDESHSGGLGPEGEDEFELVGHQSPCKNVYLGYQGLSLSSFVLSDGVKPTIVVTAVVPIRKIFGSGFSISIRTGNR